VIPEIEIWRAAKLVVTRYGEAANLESARRAEELAADGDLAGVAVWLRIIDATGQLAITTFRARALSGCLGARSRLSSNSSNIIAGRRFRISCRICHVSAGICLTSSAIG
jgi:hypothetical protein